MALLRIQDVHDIMELTPEQLREAGWPPRNIMRLRQATHPQEAISESTSSVVVRRDITQVQHSKRGNIQKAILASYDTNRKRTHDELTRDFYAPSCQDSRQSVLNSKSHGHFTGKRVLSFQNGKLCLHVSEVDTSPENTT